MHTTCSYQAAIPTRSTYIKKALKDTQQYYTQLVTDLITIINNEWNTIQPIKNTNQRKTKIEQLTHKTKQNPTPKYPQHDQKHKNTPAYMRRAATADALAAVASYQTNHKNWENTDPKTRGKEPQLGTPKQTAPTFYKGGSYKLPDDTGKLGTVLLKLRTHNSWNWVAIPLNPADARYIENKRALPGHTMQSPVLVRKRGGNKWALRFAFDIETQLSPDDYETARVLAVDLGVNTAATCVVMEPDGTVVARRFVRFATEEGRIKHCLGDMRRKQSKGARRLKRSWAHVNNLNADLSRKIVSAVVDMAVEYSCDSIACEYLDTRGRIRGSRKHRLQVWRKREVYRLLCASAHVWGLHVHQVCAWGTSRLAFDGSGRVLRGSEIVDGAGVSRGLSYSWVEFSSGKLYRY